MIGSVVLASASPPSWPGSLWWTLARWWAGPSLLAAALAAHDPSRERLTLPAWKGFAGRVQ